MKIVELLMEIGDRSYDYEPQSYTSDQGLKPWQQKAFNAFDKAHDKLFKQPTVPNSSYRFKTTDGREYQVFMDATTQRGTGLSGINVRFFEVSPEGEYRTDVLNPRARQQTVGDELKVFSTVLNVVRAYVEQHNPAFIYFSAKSDEPSRVSLYSRFAKNIDRYLPGFHLDQQTQRGGSTNFLFTTQQQQQ